MVYTYVHASLQSLWLQQCRGWTCWCLCWVRSKCQPWPSWLRLLSTRPADGTTWAPTTTSWSRMSSSFSLAFSDASWALMSASWTLSATLPRMVTTSSGDIIIAKSLAKDNFFASYSSTKGLVCLFVFSSFQSLSHIGSQSLFVSYLLNAITWKKIHNTPWRFKVDRSLVSGLGPQASIDWLFSLSQTKHVKQECQPWWGAISLAVKNCIFN